MQNIKPMQYNAFSIYFWLSGLCPIWLAGETGMYIYISISQDFKPLMYMMDLMLHFYLNFIEKSYSDIIML